MTAQVTAIMSASRSARSSRARRCRHYHRRWFYTPVAHIHVRAYAYLHVEVQRAKKSPLVIFHSLGMEISLHAWMALSSDVNERYDTPRDRRSRRASTRSRYPTHALSAYTRARGNLIGFSIIFKTLRPSTRVFTRWPTVNAYSCTYSCTCVPARARESLNRQRGMDEARTVIVVLVDKMDAARCH